MLKIRGKVKGGRGPTEKVGPNPFLSRAIFGTVLVVLALNLFPIGMTFHEKKK